MTLLAGYAPDGDSSGTVHLATLLARSSGEPLVICAVIPSPPPPGMARVDAEYHQQLRAEAEAALAKARADMPSDVDVTYVVHEAQSTSSGLLDLVHEHEAKMIVLDSSTAGVFGHVALGSVTSRLLHSSDVPVALAPRGFRTKPGEVVRRVTAATRAHPIKTIWCSPPRPWLRVSMPDSDWRRLQFVRTRSTRHTRDRGGFADHL